MPLFISFLVACTVYLFFWILIDLQGGNKGKKGHLKSYYAYIQGEKKHRKSWSESFLGLNQIQRSYSFNTSRYMLYAIPVCLAIFLFISFFFRSLPFAFIVSLIGLWYPRMLIIAKINKRRTLLNYQLKEAMYSLSSSLKAGASLQKAIDRSVYDLERIFYGDKEAPIVTEFRRMADELRMGYTVEETLKSFRDRVVLEDVDDFVNATLIVKVKGGNLTEILANISKVISEKIQIKQEIDVMTAGKRMEAQILSFMPIAIVVSLTLLSPEYMAPMYESVAGKALMFIGFVFVIVNYVVSRRIVNIDV